MKIKVWITLFCAMTVLAVAPAITAQKHARDDRERDRDRDRELTAQDEFRQSYQLAPGAQVEVRNINGPLDIQTTSGNTAEVYVQRSARTKEELEYYKVVVEQAGNVFRVYTQQPPEEDRNHVSVHHRAILKLPRPADLTVRNINGHARIGEVDGPVHLGNINGPLEVGHVAGFAELSNINGSMTMTLEQLSERGVQMRNINGSISFRFLDQPNADLDVQSFNGTVDSSMSNLTVQKTTRTSFRGQLGAGGTPITGSHINGTITLRGASEK
jgi:hypothetical protein